MGEYTMGHEPKNNIAEYIEYRINVSINFVYMYITKQLCLPFLLLGCLHTYFSLHLVLIETDQALPKYPEIHQTSLGESSLGLQPSSLAHSPSCSV